MLITFFITIVFIAELIIALSAILNLRRLSAVIVDANETLKTLKPGIKDISDLVRKISAQMLEFSKRFVERVQAGRDDLIIKTLLKILVSGMILKHLKKSKTGKLFARGLSILGIVV